MWRYLPLILWLLVYSSYAADPAVELFAASSQGKITQVETLLAQGVDVDARTGNGRTALMGAAYFGNERITRLLLGFGADVNAADNRGITPLMDAVSGGWVEISRLLLTAGANINATDNNGQSVLDKAQRKGVTDILTLLLNNAETQVTQAQKPNDDNHPPSQEGKKNTKQEKDTEQSGQEK